MATENADFVEENAHALARMRAIVERVDDAELSLPVHEGWTVADVLAHTAFWDARVQSLVVKLQRGERFTPDDEEPEDVWWINDAVWRMLRAVEPGVVARLSLAIASDTDALVAKLSPERVYPRDPTSLINPFRAWHRNEHLDEIDTVIGPPG